jgi:hypothetical protein
LIEVALNNSIGQVSDKGRVGGFVGQRSLSTPAGVVADTSAAPVAAAVLVAVAENFVVKFGERGIPKKRSV